MEKILTGEISESMCYADCDEGEIVDPSDRRRCRCIKCPNDCPEGQFIPARNDCVCVPRDEWLAKNSVGLGESCHDRKKPCTDGLLCGPYHPRFGTFECGKKEADVDEVCAHPEITIDTKRDCREGLECVVSPRGFGQCKEMQEPGATTDGPPEGPETCMLCIEKGGEWDMIENKCDVMTPCVGGINCPLCDCPSDVCISFGGKWDEKKNKCECEGSDCDQLELECKCPDCLCITKAVDCPKIPEGPEKISTTPTPVTTTTTKSRKYLKKKEDIYEDLAKNHPLDTRKSTNINVEEDSWEIFHNKGWSNKIARISHLSVIPGIETMRDCQRSCENNKKCEGITFVPSLKRCDLKTNIDMKDGLGSFIGVASSKKTKRIRKMWFIS
jgi:hypothetical protein